MRVLFYLPVVTDGWMKTIVLPLIEAAARQADVHIAVPPPWAGTGIGEAALVSLREVPGTTWHVLDGPGHPSLRTKPSEPDILTDLVRTIDPDYTFCRSADVITPCRFPGKVAFLMEGDFPPLASRGRIRISGPALFDHGVIPSLDEEQRTFLMEHMRPLAEALQPACRNDADARSRFFAAMGLPEDRIVVALPLEHDGEDNFYMTHSPAPVNAPFVRDLAERLGDPCLLALTIHPAQRQNPIVMGQLEALSGAKVRILGSSDGSDVTPALARHCDAIVLRDSKSFVWPSLFGKPIFRLSRFASGGWLNAYSEFHCFDDAVRCGTARRPDLVEALVWLGFNLANNIFQVADPDLDLDTLIGRVERPFDPARWETSLECSKPDLLAAAQSLSSVGA